MTKEEYLEEKSALLEEYEMGEMSGDYYRKELRKLDERYEKEKKEGK